MIPAAHTRTGQPLDGAGIPGSLRVLLAGAVDYAGLFPPAALDMSSAVRNYSEYTASADAWMLGRFVVPLAGLDQLAEARASSPSVGSSWRPSVLTTPDLAAAVERIAAFNVAQSSSLLIDSIETKSADVDEITRVGAIAHPGLDIYVEIPVQDDPGQLVHAIRQAGLRAKIRTGGVTREAIPSSSNVARFISCCVSENVQFKATAGLHHPIRAEFPLTYATDAPRGTMFGFLNVLLAAAFMRAGLSAEDALALLELTDPNELHVEADGITWRGNRLNLAQLGDAREQVALSFGSCSFREPVDDLLALGIF